MMTNTTLFQYCQKLVVFNHDKSAVLLAKRKGEADYDGVFSFVGGKMEITDKDMVDGMRREKNEELGLAVRIRVFPTTTFNVFFRKKDGNAMVLPHIYAQFIDGAIELNDEYSEYEWVGLDKLHDFEPKIETIEPIVYKMLSILSLAGENDFVEI